MDNEISLQEASELGTLLALSKSERLPSWQTKRFQDDDGNEEDGKDKKDDNIDAVKWVVSECGHCLKPLSWGRIFFLSPQIQCSGWSEQNIIRSAFYTRW